MLSIVPEDKLRAAAERAVAGVIDQGARLVTPEFVKAKLPGSGDLSLEELRQFIADSIRGQQRIQNHWSYDPSREIALKQIRAALDTPEFRQAWVAA